MVTTMEKMAVMPQLGLGSEVTAQTGRTQGPVATYTPNGILPIKTWGKE